MAILHFPVPLIFILKGVSKNLRMGKQLKMIEGIIVTDPFWS